MDVSIRPYAPDDRDAVLSLAARLTTGTAPWRDPVAVRRTVTAWVAEALDVVDPETGPVWVALDGDAVVGVVHAGTRVHWSGEVDAYVGELVVAPTHERTGTGRRLMSRAEGWARERGHTRLTLETGATNTAARSFYAALGYVTEEVVLTRDLGG
ncbi:hypothetical protein BJF80_05510 [Serinicoccus sp. CUA-874]|uniref:GNAT family N-acetyltransferase n=1 Tax=Serinicoccus sp. CUA-874 TaxID=1517939 RepID=UPI00095F6048|nr:GNAT family N-acetyltransferase [Serinicoccus sp. CUA-874]OLT16771.1 hypothetical protein BJF80_05510 [Serinicoccus sp. CUA-874]